MKNVFSHVLIAGLLGVLTLTSLANAEEEPKPWSLGIRF